MSKTVELHAEIVENDAGDIVMRLKDRMGAITFHRASGASGPKAYKKLKAILDQAPPKQTGDCFMARRSSRRSDRRVDRSGTRRTRPRGALDILLASRAHARACWFGDPESVAESQSHVHGAYTCIRA